MGSSPSNSACCKCKCNGESSEKEISSLQNTKSIIKIQSIYRGFIFRKKNPDLYRNINCFSIRGSSSFSDLSKQIKEISMNYSTEIQDNNPKILKLKNLLPKFELDEKEAYLLNTATQLKTMGLLYPGNTIYKGTVNSKFQREGFGKLFLSDGSIYEGFFKENKMEGRGRLLNIEGFIYDGEFKNNLACGYGKYVGLDGTVYKGTWDNNKQNGIGDVTYNDNSHYIGNFVDGFKNGKGKFFFPEGNIYDGNFYNNEIKGEGLYKWRDGRIYMGIWENNKMNGYGIFCWPDNKRYYGHYTNNNKDGFGIFYWTDGKKFEGFWKSGKQHGFGLITSSKISEYGEWFEGKHVKTITDDNEIDNIKKIILEKRNNKEFSDFVKNTQKYEKEIGIDNIDIS